jgi:tetratricopeptide (TPR) repeat protein
VIEKKHTFLTDKKTGDRYTIVAEYPITRYKCGLKAGDQVRLKKNLTVTGYKNRPTGEVHPKGEICTVLRGSIFDGEVELWVRLLDGKETGWEDKRESISEWFEYIKRNNKGNKKSGQKKLLTPAPHIVRIAAADIYNERGVTYFKKGQYSKAIANYDKALESNPRYAPAYTNRGAAFLRKGMLEKAKADLDKAVKLKPKGKREMAYYHRGEYYKAIGKHNKAIVDYSKAINLNPWDFDAYNKRGEVYHQKGRQKEAVKDYSEAIKVNPKYAAAYINRGDAYLSIGQYNDAIADFNKAIKMNPSNAVIYNERAIAYFYEKKFKKAWNDVVKAQNLGLKVHPGFLKALHEMLKVT